MQRREQKKTARFYRVTATDDEGAPFILPALPWKDILEHYRMYSYVQRRELMDGSVHVFEPRPTGPRHLAVHRLKNETEFLNRIDNQGAVAQIMAADGDGAYADTSVVSFLPFGNLFGMVSGGLSAPRHSKMALWLNRIQPWEGHKLVYAVHPLMASPELDRLSGETGAKRVEVSIPAGRLAMAGDSSTGDRLREVSGELPDADLRLTISYGNRHPSASEGNRLMAFVRDLAASLGVGAKAEASVFHEDGDRIVSDIVDLVQYHVAESFTVPLSQGGIMIDMAAAGIDRVAEEKAGALRRAFENESSGDG